MSYKETDFYHDFYRSDIKYLNKKYVYKRISDSYVKKRIKKLYELYHSNIHYDKCRQSKLIKFEFPFKNTISIFFGFGLKPLHFYNEDHFYNEENAREFLRMIKSINISFDSKTICNYKGNGDQLYWLLKKMKLINDKIFLSRLFFDPEEAIIPAFMQNIKIYVTIEFSKPVDCDYFIKYVDRTNVEFEDTLIRC
jgi:hypothetical protein